MECCAGHTACSLAWDSSTSSSLDSESGLLRGLFTALIVSFASTMSSGMFAAAVCGVPGPCVVTE